MQVSCGFRQLLRGETNHGVSKLDFASNPRLTEDALPATDHAHNFKAFDRGVSRLHRLKATGWAEASLDATMVCPMMLFRYFEVRCLVSPLSLRSRCSRWMALG
jgi:hypothetical protein